MPGRTNIIFYYQFQTKHGVISLIPEPGGRYKVMFKEENLGSYASAGKAADDVGGGHTFSPAGNVDFAELQVPRDLGEWDKKVFAEISRLRPA